jgi:hypothetical protein
VQEKNITASIYKRAPMLSWRSRSSTVWTN